MRMIILTILFSAIALHLSADIVELRDGSRLEGRILAEKEDGLELEIGRNEAGTIRRVLLIHRSEIRSYAADQQGRLSGQEGEPVTRLSGREYVQRLLREAESKVAAKDFEAAILQFQQAADIAGQTEPDATPEDRVEALEQRAHALRLLQAALEGRLKFLEGRAAGGQDSLDDQRKALERQWADLRDEKEELRREQPERRTELGRHNPKASDLAEREQNLRLQIAALNQRQFEASELTRRVEEEKNRTEAQIQLVEERVKMAENEARNARRDLRHR